MNKKTTIAIGIFFVAFLLVTVGIVSANTLLQSNESGDSVQQQIHFQATVAAYEEQQQAYDDLVQQANEQLMEANATIAAITEPSEAQPTASAGLTPEEAVALAQEVAVYPETLNGSPELVNFEGTVAYEVKYEEGAIYVSFATGQILLNGTLTLTDEITLEQAEEIAKNYMGLSSVYLTDVVTVNGVELYRTIFSAGHFVYIDHFGQIIYVQMYANDDIKETQEPSFDDDDDHFEEEDDDEYEEPDDD